MTYNFLPPAQAELEEAVDYYNDQQPGLGDEFAEEIRRTIHRILAHPEAWAKLSRRTRRCRTNKFPYGIIYQIRGDSILVVAVMHLHRKPSYWKDRL